jgi:hypothetical protein
MQENDMRNRFAPFARVLVVGTLALGAAPDLARAMPFASAVEDYTPGTNPQPGFIDPNVALGEPSRFTPGEFGGDVTPGSGAFLADQVVSIGSGGSLTVRFAAPVENDPLNPFQVDLIVYGNAFFGVDFQTGLATGLHGGFDEPAIISVSQDGQSFFDVPDVRADSSLWPTMGYVDTPGFFASGGTTPTDFNKPVNPALGLADVTGLDHAGVAALWNGAGGGAGVVLDDLGLDWILYVRVRNEDDASGATAEFDGFADVNPTPEPGSALLLAAGLTGLAALSRARLSRRVACAPILRGCAQPERSSSEWR